ncbi:MAG: hypothetical protein GC159_21565 [Phycisphaera sp.]|nr:hypothetical protein [Phycisphaera sp.]
MNHTRTNVATRTGVVVVTLLLLIHVRAATAQHTVEVKFGAQNVENFFDVFDDPYNRDESAEPKPVPAINALGKQMRAVDADFFGVEELESLGLLARFRDWQFKDRGYDYIWANQMRAQRGINVGCLSRVPMGAVHIWRYAKLTVPGDDRTWSFARDMAAVDIMPADDLKITVFMVHLKSKRNGTNDIQSNKWRLAEALGLRRLAKEILDHDPDALVVAMGDFNDTPDSPPIQALTSTADGGPVFVDPHAGIPADQRISYLKEPYRSNIDYILLSPALAKHVVEGTAVIGHGELEGSDHAPVTVTVKLPTKQADARATWPWKGYVPATGVFLKRASKEPEPEPAKN